MLCKLLVAMVIEKGPFSAAGRRIGMEDQSAIADLERMERMCTFKVDVTLYHEFPH